MMTPMLASLLLAAEPVSAAVHGCGDSNWNKLREQRKEHYHHGNFARVLEYVDCEAAALRRLPPDDPSLQGEPGLVASACEPLEVGFYICSTALEDKACADRYLERQRQWGCCEHPERAAECHRNAASQAMREQDFPAALAALTRAATSAEARLVGASAAVEADAWLDLATTEALRLNLAAQIGDLEAMRAGVAAVVELTDYARAASDANPALVGDLLNLAAWGLLLAREGDVPDAGALGGDATALLERALLDYRRSDAPTDKIDNVQINLALAALHRGDPWGAQEWLDRVTTAGLSQEECLWFHALAMRIALTMGSPVALEASHRTLNQIGDAGRVPMAKWFSAWLRGREREGHGDLTDAIEAYREAEATLEVEIRRRSSAQRIFLGGRAQPMFGDSARRLVGLLVDAGELESAAAVARHARNRALRMSAPPLCHNGALRPVPGELRLLYVRRSAPAARGIDTEGRWIGFAITEAGVRSVALEVPRVPAKLFQLSDEDLEPWSTALLVPFASEIAAAKSVVILATEALHDVPFHALPWAGRALIEAVPVVYALDVAGCHTLRSVDDNRYLVFYGTDLRHNEEELHLRDEAEAVSDRLRAGDRRIELLAPRTARALSAGPLFAPGVRVAHFVVHGHANDTLLASDNALNFTASLELTNRDVLEQDNVPEFVYLNACRASFHDAETLGGSASLANAFLLRGSRYVIAPVEELNSELARAMADRFYAFWDPDDLDGVPKAFQQAYRSCRDECQPSGLAHLAMLRVYTQ